MRKLWLIFAQATTIALAVLFVLTTLKPQSLKTSSAAAPAAALLLNIEPFAATPGKVGHSGFSLAARRAAPAVVSITASKGTSSRAAQTTDPWLRRHFGLRGKPPSNEPTQQGLGSGVIVTADGYLLTNNHVVEGASEIEVLLTDGRQARATLIGTDPESDVALLKIDLDKLPVIHLGNAETLQVGDSVLAIGNPFNVGQTVTSGIVSALGRSQLGINTFENFIQTDAAINPGNSGGALVDAEGNLVGINTAIFSRSGGSLGIGFAIPADTARMVMESLVRDGSVIRGWIGVEPRDLTAEMAESLRLPVKSGVLITGVLQNGPAGNGGMKPGDVVVKIADKTIANTAQLFNAVAALKPGEPASIAVQRGDRAVDLKVQVAQRPATQQRVER